MIMPTSELVLFQGMPLNSDYTDTFHFDSIEEQYKYFESLNRKAIFSNVTHVTEKMVTLEVAHSEVVHCNYCMYKNKNINPKKWIFAFITDVIYINDRVAKIELETDVIQSYFFDLQFSPSMIERNHVRNDNIINKIPESFDVSDTTLNFAQVAGMYSEGAVICVATSIDVDDNNNMYNVVGGYYGNVYSGVKIITRDNAGEINNLLAKLTVENKSDAIVSIFMAPKKLITEMNAEAKKYNFGMNRPDNLGGYVPQNKKLLNFPYMYLEIDNMQGNSGSYAYEDWENYTAEDNPIKFQLSAVTSPNFTALFYPLNYKRITGANASEGVAMDNFPQCSYTVNTYKAWLAQNAHRMRVNPNENLGLGIANAVSNAFGLLQGNVSGLVNQGMALLAHNANKSDMKTKPPEVYGSAGAQVAFAIGQSDYLIKGISVKPEIAQRIDRFFNLYGYAINDFDNVSTKNRETYTFIKTLGFSGIGKINDKDYKKFCSVFDNGIRFWCKPQYIYNYNISNRPLES